MSNDKVTLPLSAIVEVIYLKEGESYLRSKTKDGDKKPTLTIAEVEGRFLSLKAGHKRLGMAHLVYTRRLLREGKLEGIKVKVKGVERWLVTKAAIEGYSKRKAVNLEYRNYILRLRPEQEAQVRKFLEQLDPGSSLEFAYVKKEKDSTEPDTVWAKVVASIT